MQGNVQAGFSTENEIKKMSHGEAKGIREDFSLFFTLSAQFPFYFLPEDSCLQNVQRMLSMDRRQENRPE